MARPERTESASLPIWLKLSEADAAQMERVLARPEFAGWTRAEWCLEIIQTALRYYARRGSADEPGRGNAGARPASAAPEHASAAPEHAPAAAKPRRAAPEPRRAAPEPRRAAPGAKPPAVPKAKRPARKAQRPGPEAGRPGPEAAPPAPERAGPAAEAGPPEPPECSHPAEARDYQTGTCGACGAILWD